MYSHSPCLPQSPRFPNSPSNVRYSNYFIHTEAWYILFFTQSFSIKPSANRCFYILSFSVPVCLCAYFAINIQDQFCPLPLFYVTLSLNSLISNSPPVTNNNFSTSSSCPICTILHQSLPQDRTFFLIYFSLHSVHSTML
jgi:hypothetical protein